MKKAYYFLFYSLYKFFRFFSGDDLHDWKAGVVIGALEILILLTLAGQLELLTGINVLAGHDPIYIVLPVAVCLSLFIYWTFWRKNNWRKYEAEFDTYSKGKTVFLRFLVMFFIIAIVAGQIFTFYQYSQVDWTKK